MPLFITYASYSNTGIKGIIDKPIDRTEAIRTLAEKAGGKLIAAYMTTGPHDVVVITEQADGSDAVAVGMAAAASGAVAKIETVRAWTLGEFKGIAERRPGWLKCTFRLGGNCALQGEGPECPSTPGVLRQSLR